MSQISAGSPSGGQIPKASKKRKRNRGNKPKNSVEIKAPLEDESKSQDSEKNRSINKKVKFESNESIQSSTSEGTAKSVESEDQTRKLHRKIEAHESDESIKSKEKSAPVTPKSPGSNRKKEIVFHDDDDEDSYDGDSFNMFGNKGPMNRSSLSRRSEQLLTTRKTLPVYQHRDEILKHVNDNSVTVVIGETGSGKSTQIPQLLMTSNRKQIAVTQPRRVAAASLAARVSEEYGCQLGEDVGYQVRFSNITSRKTKLKYLTDGMLLREIMMDNNLNKYSTIIIDEAHERTILSDLIIGFLKDIVVNNKRPDLKVIIMSATLNAKIFSTFFSSAPVLYIEGKTFPVQSLYLQNTADDIVDTMITSIIQVNMGEEEGDILCFLPGQEEIDTCVSTLQNLAGQLPKDAPLIVPCALYAALSPAQQAKVFERLSGRKRKVILATNIAETSITVSGVKYVIDSGLRKVKVWKHQLGLSTLLTTSISQSSAKQRAGRAGRETAGKVFRLYPESKYLEQFPRQQEPEIVRNDLILPVLTLKKIGVHDLLNWYWLEHPGQESIIDALKSLYSLGALNDGGNITALGYRMAVLPLPPQLSVVLITAAKFGVLSPVVDIIACLSVDNLILNVGNGEGEMRDEVNYKRRQYCPQGCQYGDLISLKELFDHFNGLFSSGNVNEAKSLCKDLFISFKGFKNVLKIRSQLKEYMASVVRQDSSISPSEKEAEIKAISEQLSTEDDMYNSVSSTPSNRGTDIPSILKSFLKGYVTNTAIGMPDRSYRTLNTGQLISIHPSSNLFGKVNLDGIMYIEYVYTSKGYGRTCSVIQLDWLQEIAPHILGAAKINIEDTD